MSEARRWEIMELKDGSVIVMAKLDPEAREALLALLEEDHWEDASDAVSGALVTLVETRLAEPETFAEKMAKRSKVAMAQKVLESIRKSGQERSARGVILEYVVGEKYWSEVVEDLAEWPENFLWQDVENAHARGWISTAQYWDLSSRVLGQGPGVVL